MAGFMAALVLFQSLVMGAAFFVSRVFFMPDATSPDVPEAFEMYTHSPVARRKGDAVYARFVRWPSTLDMAGDGQASVAYAAVSADSAPEQAPRGIRIGARPILLFGILMAEILALAAFFLLAHFAARKISGLTRYVRTLSPHMEIAFEKTGILEVDDLMTAVETLNKAVMDTARTTSRILDLSLMPMGGFEISSSNRYVVLTEYVSRLLGLPAATPMTQEAWEKIYGELTAHPTPYWKDIYAYTDRQGAEVFLRILVSQTDACKAGVIIDVTQGIEEYRKISYGMDMDTLTHLYSRAAFKREAHMRMQREPDAVGVMAFVDLDNLKHVNDTFGHDMGDRLIVRAGELLGQLGSLGGIVSRISGDEFAIYWHGFPGKEEAREMIMEQLSKARGFVLIKPDGTAQSISYSAGIAFYPEDSDNVTDLLKLSDYAMYEAKHKYKGFTVEFNRQSYNEGSYMMDSHEAMSRLFDQKLTRFSYQPIVDARTGRIFAYEASLWPLLDNFRSSQEIFDAAAAQSKLDRLEHLVFTTAFQEAYDNRRVLGEIKIFIHSIPSYMLSPEDHLMIEREYGDITSNIVVVMSEEEENASGCLGEKLNFLRRNGIKTAVDNLSDEYFDEKRILSMHPDIVKVDISRISDMSKSSDKQQSLSHMISFYQSKGIPVVATGISRHEELAQAIRQGIDYIQGDYVGGPAFVFKPADEEIQAEIRRFSAEAATEPETAI